MYDVNDLINDFAIIPDVADNVFDVHPVDDTGMDEIHVGFNTYGDVEGRLEHRIHEYEQTRDYYGAQAAGSLVEWLEVQGF